MKITKLGHCCLVIETKGKRFLTDPGSFSTAQNNAKSIDSVVITHEHADHLHVESLKTVLKNNPTAQVIANTSVGKILEKEGIAYTKVADGESVDVGGVVVSGRGTVHAEIYKEVGQVENTGYFFDDTFFYPGDAFYNPGTPVDILALPVAGPWCKIKEAIEYVLALKPRIAFPVHDGNMIQPGIAHRVPGIKLPEAGIQFIALELGKETEL